MTFQSSSSFGLSRLNHTKPGNGKSRNDNSLGVGRSAARRREVGNLQAKPCVDQTSSQLTILTH